MLAQREAALALRESAMAQREAALALRESALALREAALVQHDPALDAFYKLRRRAVRAEKEDTALTFLARFQSAAASLEPEEKVKLEVYAHESGVELLKAVFVDPLANTICALDWTHDGEDDVNSVILFFTNNCPELASLEVNFKHHSAFDFATSVLKHPCTNVKVLKMPEYTGGDIHRFFAALEQSKVSAFTIQSSSKLYRGLCKYLAKDLLVGLYVVMSSLNVAMSSKQVPSAMMKSLAKCTRLADLGVTGCNFSQPTLFANLPKSITALGLCDCGFGDGFDWSFLADSNVQDLGFNDVEEVDGSQLGKALAVHLQAKELDQLYFWGCDFVNETLAAVGAKIGRIKRLDFDGDFDEACIKLIARVLQSSKSEMKELRFPYEESAASSIEAYLVPALRHPKCNLNKLSIFDDEPEYEAAAKALEHQFRNRRALFALLQGQQIRRLYCPLRRLPVEMFRMVGEVLV